MRISIRILMMPTIAIGWTVASGVLVNARPSNLEVFKEIYPIVAKRNTMKCSVCHDGGNDKKLRNNYGEALSKNIGKNEKVKAKIEEALVKTEKEPSAIEGKTFGDLLRQGRLPDSK